jgi:hypothetical protein
MAKAPAKPDSASLARELAKLRAEHATVFARDAELKSLLIEIAKSKGENFKEVATGLGTVNVSAPKEARCKGTAPELVIEAFLAAPERTRDNLIERGIVKIVEQWTGAYYGAVTVKLFPQAKDAAA